MTGPDAFPRRMFLGSFVAAGLAAGRFTRAGTEKARKMTIDLVASNVGVKATLPEAIDLAHRFGFESVAPDARYLAGLSDGRLDDLLADLRGKRLVFGAASLSVDFRGDGAAFETGLKTLPGEAKALQRAGVTRIGTWLRPSDPRLTYMANLRRHVERLGKVAGILGDHGLRLGLEYVGPKTSWTSARYPFVHTMAEARELIDGIGKGNVGLVLDSWHWYTAGESVDDLLTLSNKDVVACDLNDAPAGVPVDRQKDNVRDLPCATGVIDLKGFLGALVRIGYDGPVRAEPFKAELRGLSPDESVGRTAKAMKTAFALIGG